ncbi:hypothetical protein Unana1_00749 [Umbelopsis nana]
MTETQLRIDHLPEHFNPEELCNAFPSPRDLSTSDPLDAITSSEDEKIIRPEEFGVAFSGLHTLISGAVDLTMSLCRVRSDIGKVAPAESKPVLPRSDSVRSLNEMNMSGQHLETMTPSST